MHAGVSLGTVSHVLNHPERVTEATRARVEASIAALRFRPNRVARNLAGGRSGTIGLVLTDLSNSLFVDIARATENPLVLLNVSAPATWFCSVSIDNELGGHLAAQHLLSRGRRRLVLVGGPDVLRPVHDRKVGVRRALAEAGVTAVPGDVAVTGYSDNRAAWDLPITLTTVAQPGERLGQEGARLVVDEAFGGTAHRHEAVVLRPHLVVRDSAP